MTGFARLEETSEIGNFNWEMRSVNHRYLEINFRLPEEVRSLEPQLRKHLQASLARGKVDCIFRYQLTENQSAALEVNNSLLESLIEQVNQVSKKLPESAATKAIDLLAWPGIVNTAQTNMDEFRSSCLQLFKKATKQLVEMRSTEGNRLAELLQDRCDGIDGIVKKLRARQPEVLTAIKEKLKQRVSEITTELDESRLEQELAYLAQKLDVAEELDRIESHLSEMTDIFDRKEPIGRRLDFLMQEFHREANTLASKSADIETTQAAVDLKVLIEQMREQVQNVE